MRRCAQARRRMSEDLGALTRPPPDHPVRQSPPRGCLQRAPRDRAAMRCFFHAPPSERYDFLTPRPLRGHRASDTYWGHRPVPPNVPRRVNRVMRQMVKAAFGFDAVLASRTGLSRCGVRRPLGIRREDLGRASAAPHISLALMRGAASVEQQMLSSHARCTKFGRSLCLRAALRERP